LDVLPARRQEAPPGCRMVLVLPTTTTSPSWYGKLPKTQAYNLRASISRSFKEDSIGAAQPSSFAANRPGEKANMSELQAQSLVSNWLWSWYELPQEEKDRHAAEYVLFHKTAPDVDAFTGEVLVGADKEPAAGVSAPVAPREANSSTSSSSSSSSSATATTSSRCTSSRSHASGAASQTTTSATKKRPTISPLESQSQVAKRSRESRQD
jgi:hypothetical protein